MWGLPQKKGILENRSKGRACGEESHRSEWRGRNEGRHSLDASGFFVRDAQSVRRTLARCVPVGEATLPRRPFCGAGCACVVGQRGGLERRGGGATAEVQMPDQCVRQVFGHAVGRRIRFGREAAMSLLLCLGGALEAEVARILSKSDPVVGIARRCADRAEVVTAAEAGVGSVAVLREWDLKLSKVSIDVGLL